MSLLSFPHFSPEEIESKLDLVNIKPDNWKFKNYFYCIMLYLNLGNIEEARSLARKVVDAPFMKENAFGTRRDIMHNALTPELIARYSRGDEWFHRPEFKTFENFMYYLLRVAGQKDEAAVLLSQAYLKNPTMYAFELRKWVEVIVEEERNYNGVIQGGKTFMDIPYRKINDDYFGAYRQDGDFAKMMVKKEYRLAGNLIEKFKVYIEQTEGDWGLIFNGDYYTRYLTMIDALAQASPGSTMLVKEYLNWKNKVDW